MIGFIDTTSTHTSGLQAMQRYRWSTKLLQSGTHSTILSLQLVVSWQRVYDTVTVAHYCWFSHYKSLPTSSSLHRLIISCHHSPAASSIQFFCTEAHILAGWHLETRLITKRTELNSFLPLGKDHAENTTSLLLGRRVYSAVAQQRKLLDCCLRIICRGDVFTE
jgi:hypothetical protein